MKRRKRSRTRHHEWVHRHEGHPANAAVVRAFIEQMARRFEMTATPVCSQFRIGPSRGVTSPSEFTDADVHALRTSMRPRSDCACSCEFSIANGFFGAKTIEPTHRFCERLSNRWSGNSKWRLCCLAPRIPVMQAAQTRVGNCSRVPCRFLLNGSAIRCVLVQ